MKRMEKHELSSCERAFHHCKIFDRILLKGKRLCIFVYFSHFNLLKELKVVHSLVVEERVKCVYSTAEVATVVTEKMWINTKCRHKTAKEVEAAPDILPSDYTEEKKFRLSLRNFEKKAKRKKGKCKSHPKFKESQPSHIFFSPLLRSRASF